MGGIDLNGSKSRLSGADRITKELISTSNHRIEYDFSNVFNAGCKLDYVVLISSNGRLIQKIVEDDM